MGSRGIEQGDKIMCIVILENIKLIAEVITSIATAGVIISHLFKFCNPTIKKFFKITVPLFFKGYTDIYGKKHLFFKGLKVKREREIKIINAISKNAEAEDVLVLDKEALFEII